MKHRIRVDALSRVEGEGSLRLELDGDEVIGVRFGLYEPPRLFEGFLRGRDFREVPDMTARICGICPVAHQTTSIRALEAALGWTADPATADLRRLLYCAEWIESHALHIFFLHAPDFLGYPDALAMAAEHRPMVEAGLFIKKTGNALMALIGGREIHPINLRVGGFYQAPRQSDLASLVPNLERSLAAAQEAVGWLAGLDFPEYRCDEVLVALRDADGYAIEGGDEIVVSDGARLPAADFLGSFHEEQVEHSTALHCLYGRGGAPRAYLVGPLARYNLNRDQLTPLAALAARAAGLGDQCRNPFRSILVRAVELVLACEESLRLIAAYRGLPDFAPGEVRAGAGAACTEAPRGLLFHAYQLDRDGGVVSADIIPPTSQNQRAIENDLAGVAQRNRHLPPDALRRLCEQAIRNYDPCISCSTH